MSKARTRIFAALAGALLLIAAGHRANSPRVMSDAANTLLSDDQKLKAVFDFNSEERLNWHFIPKERKGLPLKAMTHEQRPLAMALLSSAVSQQGFIKATSIMSLEEILKIQEKNTPPGRRDPENYLFSIFGTPSESGTWGLRVEGHHLSLNFTITANKVASSPMFYGTNPHLVKSGPRAGTRVLAAEEDLGRELLLSLTPEQRKIAVVSEEALKDIITMADRKAALKGAPNGLAASKLNAKQKQLLMSVLEEYANNAPEQAAHARMAQVKAAVNSMYFAWTGSAEKGKGHYYRISAPSFLVEYDNTQNDANHVHSVWRDYNGDFGYDLLGNHYTSSH